MSVTSIVSPPAAKISDLVKTEYRADVLDADRRAQASRFNDPDHVSKLLTMVCESRWVNHLGSFSVAEKNFPSVRHSASLKLSASSYRYRPISAAASIAPQ